MKEIEGFFNAINRKISNHNIQFNYNVADGVEVKSDFKFIEFDYNIKMNMFSFQIKKTLVTNSFISLIIIQEISKAGEIIETLKELTQEYSQYY